ncbi:type IV toxin-antitoxin system AbiEi family antitoxin domain-containing protein [Patulibacter defluvii]|uniref:type IV toxin-antitoxin system AbiEi family antitoxin domain-containing protein n=1 Tax=Patulibacter defluvii TaxID=3095358 RepID=UPI002A74BA63|nr:type IV toxin-antitoxin system AbiEi family antitoxin domain-containing protein [Patulibacter sp. DM4]
MDSWRRAVAIADRQGGVIGRGQLAAAGITPTTVDRRRAAGILHRRQPGVYAVGRPTVSPYGAAFSAVLATRGAGALAARSALAAVAALPWPSRPEVIVTGGTRRIPDVAVRRTRHLPEDDLWTDQHGLRICRWPRAIVDLAASGTVVQLQDALDGVERQGLLNLPRLEAAIAAHRRPGLPKLRRALEPFLTLTDEEHRSLLERFATVALRRAGIDGFALNAPFRLPGGRTIVIDLLFAAAGLAVEIDGRATHERARQFQEDRRRDRELLKLGIRSARFTWQDVRFRPAQVCRDVDTLLARSRGG